MGYQNTFKRGHCRAVGFTLIHRKGEQMPNARFTDAEVAQIKREHGAGASINELAAKYKSHRRTILGIVRGLRYGHVE